MLLLPSPTLVFEAFLLPILTFLERARSICALTSLLFPLPALLVILPLVDTALLVILTTLALKLALLLDISPLLVLLSLLLPTLPIFLVLAT